MSGQDVYYGALGVKTVEERGRKQEWTEGEAVTPYVNPTGSSLTKWPIKVVLNWTQKVRPLYSSLSRVWATLDRVCLCQGGAPAEVVSGETNSTSGRGGLPAFPRRGLWVYHVLYH